jgi:hydrogenase expression/formation protein HypC
MARDPGTIRLSARRDSFADNEIRHTDCDKRNMCLAIPARIVELEGDKAVVDAMGNRFKAKTTLIPQSKLGDLVLVHAGFAISLVDEEEAMETWDLLAQIDSFQKTTNRISG